MTAHPLDSDGSRGSGSALPAEERIPYNTFRPVEPAQEPATASWPEPQTQQNKQQKEQDKYGQDQ